MVLYKRATQLLLCLLILAILAIYIGRKYIGEKSHIIYVDEHETDHENGNALISIDYKPDSFIHDQNEQWIDPRPAPDLIPFLNCTINNGTTCTAVWGFSNTHASQLSVPLFNNKFSPSPIYRGQTTVFPANTLVYRAFNNSRPCSQGNLSWTLRDPITGITRTVTANTTLGNTCQIQPITINCELGNSAQVANRLQQCQTQCGNSCSYCGQVYSFCENSGLLVSNFTLENCIIIGLGFTPVSGGCAYQQVVENCCSNVGPPIAPPVTPPVEPPVTPPVAPPPVCGNTTFELFAEAYSCLFTLADCTLAPINCSAQIAAVVNSDPAAIDCINQAIEAQSVNCQQGLETGYTTCCNQTIPEPDRTAYRPLPTMATLLAYECMDRTTTGITCAQRVTTCDILFPQLTNDTFTENCLATNLANSSNLEDCDFFTVLGDCCSQTPPEQVCSSDGQIYLDFVSCLSVSTNCTLALENCTSKLQALTNLGQDLIDCFSIQLEGHVGICRNFVDYALCCNASLPLENDCNITSTTIENYYSCIENVQSTDNCGTKASLCNAQLPSETEQEQCIKFTTATTLDDSNGCSLLKNIDLCCNDTITVTPTCNLPNETSYLELFSCLVANISDSCSNKVNSCTQQILDFSGGDAQTAQCISDSLAGYTFTTNCQAALPTVVGICCANTSYSFTPEPFCPLVPEIVGFTYACATNQALGNCTQRFSSTVPFCSTILEILGNTTTTDLCLRVGFNSSTNLDDCDFETVLQSCCDPQFDATACAVQLNASNPFAAFAGVGQSIVGAPTPSTIVGNVGFGDAQSILPQVTVTGSILTNQGLAQDDILFTYTDITNLSPCTGNWGNTGHPVTFTPGLYCNTGSATINNDEVITLDALANPYTVFIFRTSGTIQFGNGVRFNLINGAHSSNVFFASSGSITYGGQLVRGVGNFISETQFMDFGANSVLTGRALMPNGNINFVSGNNNITLVPDVINPVC